VHSLGGGVTRTKAHARERPPRGGIPERLPLVGRDSDLQFLDRALGVAEQAQLRAVLLLGDPGMGKTRLAAEVAARRHDVVTLSARAYPLGTTAALGLWVEALERHLRTLDAADVIALAGESAHDLAVVLPSVGAAVGHRGSTRTPRIRVLAALANLLAALSLRSTVVVVLDDVHLADGSSWEALHFLAGTLAESRILLVLTARPAELFDDAVATGVVHALEQEGVLARRTLGPLSADEMRELAKGVVGDDVPRALTGWLMERSRGVPLFALGLLRALLEEDADLGQPVLRELPEDLSQRIRARLARLDQGDRSTLELIAVLGYRVRISDLATLTGSADAELTGALDRLVHARLLTQDEHGWDLRYEVTHPLIQEAIYQGIGAASRRSMHRRIARMLVAAGALGMAAPHFVRSSAPGDGEAIDVLCQSLHQAEQLEHHREALSLLEALLQLLPEGDVRWLTVLDQMPVQPEWVVDHRADRGAPTGVLAMQRIQQVLRNSPDIEKRASVAFNLGVLMMWGLGELAEGVRLVTEARELFAGVGRVHARMLADSELGYAHAVVGEPGEHRDTAQRVIAEARVAGYRLGELQGSCLLIWYLQPSGQLAASAPVMERALQIAREDDKLYRTSYLLAQQGWSAAMAGDMPGARLKFGECEAANQAVRDTHYPDMAAHARFVGGDLAGAVSTFREGLAWAGELSRRRAWGASIAAVALAELGELDEAASLASAAEDVFGGRPWWWHSALATWARCHVVAARGDVAAGLAGLLAGGRWVCDTEQWLFGSFILADAAELLAGVREPKLVADTAALVQAFRWPPGVPTMMALRDLAAGSVAVADGRAGDAEPSLVAAAARFADHGWPLYEARARALLGNLVAGQDRERAATELSAAVGLFDRHGAAVRRDQAAQALDRLGRRGRRALTAVGGPQSLTRREREVISLAMNGLTAREIGKRLFIGERTVETHLANVYAKLGIGSRMDLLRIAGRLDL
jgi:DNA-binding CsgD family transcriptional regulator